MMAIYVGVSPAQTNGYWQIGHYSGSFPYVFGADDEISTRINYLLQSQALKMLVKEKTSNPSEAIQPESTFIDYQVLRNDDRVFTIQINMEGCGEYCEYYQQYFSFNSSTGDIINVKDVLTKSGYLEAKIALTEERQQMLKDHISNKQEELKTSSDPESMLAEQIEMFQYCLESRDTSSFQFNRFYLKESSITFVEGRCSNHAMPHSMNWISLKMNSLLNQIN